MRFWIVLLLLALTVEAWLPIDGQDNATKAKRQENNTQQQKKPVLGVEPTAPTGNIANPGEPAAHGNKDRKADDPSGYLNTLVSPNNLPNVVLAIVGIVGIVFAVCTLREIREQTKATRDSIATLIKSERAWVVLETHPAALEPISPGAIRPYNTFRFALKNGGKTVAKLMELRGEAHLVQRSYTLRSPPEYAETPPPEHELGFRHGSVLVPGDTLEAWIEINLMLSATDIQAVRDSDKLLYVYGFLRYFDFAEKPRMLQFCYLYAEKAISWTERGELSSTPQWLIAGPPDYNTHS